MDPDSKEPMEVLRNMQEGEGMSNMSIFTDYLKILADYSGKVDAREVTHDDFVDLQQLKDRIIKAYQRVCFRKTVHDALTTIYYYLHDGFRVVLQLDPPEQGPQQGE